MLYYCCVVLSDFIIFVQTLLHVYIPVQITYSHMASVCTDRKINSWIDRKVDR